MIYPITLQQAGLSVGIALLAGHLLALFRPADVRNFLSDFPRSRPLGIILLAVAAVWSFYLVRTMDLGEFAPLRTPLQIAVPVLAILAAIYVPDFLAVRSLGMLALLAAEPLLGAAFLRPEWTRLFLVTLAYVWILAGLFWVGMPWLLRDQLNWVTNTPSRFRAAAFGGAAYGALLTGLAAALW
ncbi:MAG: hypothetical protein Fur0032_01520 [Terrimicrobiaceae bacterium]